MNRRLRADVVARARLVLDDELLAQPFREPLRHDARRDVRAPAGAIGHDPTHRPGRVVERRGGADPAPHERGQTRGKTAGKIHAWDHGACLRCRLLLGPARARRGPFRELASEGTRHRGPRTRALGDRTWFEKPQDSHARLASPRAISWAINQPSLRRLSPPLSCFLTMPLRRFLTIPS